MKLYINWLLSKDGQADLWKTGRNSRRLGVKPGAPDQLPRTGESYLNSQAEAQIPVRDRVAELAKQYIPAGASP
jgi:ABC-type Fe3+ transport system substrate-binding protein